MKPKRDIPSFMLEAQERFYHSGLVFDDNNWNYRDGILSRPKEVAKFLTQELKTAYNKGIEQGKIERDKEWQKVIADGIKLSKKQTTPLEYHARPNKLVVCPLSDYPVLKLSEIEAAIEGHETTNQLLKKEKPVVSKKGE